MSFVLPAQGLHVPAGEGPARWFSGDVYTVKLEAKATNGTVGLIERPFRPAVARRRTSTITRTRRSTC